MGEAKREAGREGCRGREKDGESLEGRTGGEINNLPADRDNVNLIKTHKQALKM